MANERHELSMRLLCETLTRRTRDISPHAELNEANIDTAIADDAVPTRRTASSRHAKARPPQLMPADISLRDLKSWRRAWNDFVEIEQLNRFPVTQQRAMLRTSLSVAMRSVLHLAIGIENDDDISVSEILDQIHEYSSTCHRGPPLVQGKRDLSWQVTLRDRDRK